MVAARDVSTEKRARPGGRFGKRPAIVGSRRPREDAVTAKRTDLADKLEIPVKCAMPAEQTCAERVPEFSGSAASVSCILARNSEVIKIRIEARDERQWTSDIAAPECVFVYPPVVK